MSLVLKEILGALAVLIGFIGYIPYVRNTFSGVTKPHFFSWLLWAVIETIAFFAQISKGGGAGSWVLGFSALVAYVVAAKAFLNKDKNITKLDWFGFIGAAIGIIAWQLTKDATAAIVIVTFVDFLAFLPTYRKAFQRPNEETVFEFFTSTVKHIMGIFALQAYSLATWLYPASLVVTNGAFTVMVLMRRKALVKR